MNPEIGRFFHAAGVLIVEGIGMTENTSFTNINRYDNYRFGWVGPTGPGIEQMTAEDGEVLYRGRNIMREYYKMPAETAETITPDGWQHTGDLGEIDDEGFLRITGRKKDLIVTAGGKNVAPSAIEGTIATSKYISQVCVIGDRRKYLTALITVDADNITAFAAANGIPGDNLDDLLVRPEGDRPDPLDRRREEPRVRVLRDHQGLPAAPRVLDRERAADADPQGQTQRRDRTLRRPHRWDVRGGLGIRNSEFGIRNFTAMTSTLELNGRVRRGAISTAQRDTQS